MHFVVFINMFVLTIDPFSKYDNDFTFVYVPEEKTVSVRKEMGMFEVDESRWQKYELGFSDKLLSRAIIPEIIRATSATPRFRTLVTRTNPQIAVNRYRASLLAVTTPVSHRSDRSDFIRRSISSPPLVRSNFSTAPEADRIN